jgi:hypothetical protein
MPKQTGKSPLLAKLGSKLEKAVTKHSTDETEFDTGGNLPAGIEGGVAQLNECCFKQIAAGKTNAGEFMFYASGIVVAPQDHNGVPIVGLRTQISEVVCDTPTRSRKTVDEHVEWILNEMRKLGLDTSDVSAENLEEAAAQLKEAAPFFRFRTWKGQPAKSGPYKGKEPMTNHVWQGACEYQGEGTPDDATKDETGDSEEETPEPENAELDLDALAKAADKGDEDAQVQLEEAAEEAGVPKKKVDAAKKWKEVAALIQAAQASEDEEEDEDSDDEDEEEESEDEDTEEESEDEEEDEDEEDEEEDEEEEVEPEVGGAFDYTPKGKRKPVSCEVVALSKSKKTVTLKNLDDGKTLYKGVPWASLIVPE